MNQFFTRRTIIIITLAILLALGGATGWYFWTHREIKQVVTITFNENVRSVTINGNIWVCKDNVCDDQEYETKLNESGQVELPDGVYYITPWGDIVSNEAIPIAVDRDHTAFTISPYYSDQYLAKLLPNETGAIRKHIQEVYPISTNYVIDAGRLYQFGEWYATSITPPVTETNLTPDSHYIILHKTNNTWRTVSKPSLYFKYTEHHDIPRDILMDVNAGIITTTEDISEDE